jgi:Glu-tRNA(Gln) amidotransferase subunit E-like FAD-binding protein
MSADSREAVRIRLEEIAARNAGRLTPEDAIEDAKDEESPLHQHFTWDDSDAAHKQRLYEARALIRSVRVTTIVDQTVHRTIAYIRDPSRPSDEGGYIATAVLRTDEDLARAALVEEFSRAAPAMLRALEVARALSLENEFAEQIGAIEALIDEVLAANPGPVAEFRAGKDKAFNSLVGQVMKASKGKANPAQVNEILKRKLG